MIEDEPHDDERGLAFDASTPTTRRRVLGLAAPGGMTAPVGYGSSSSGSAGTASVDPTAAATGTTADASVAEIPDETAGPYPDDGSNSVNVLTQRGIVRSDIASSFGCASGVAEGVLPTIALTRLDVQEGGTPVEGAAVYAWHRDREGRYSLYDSAGQNESYLCGVQETDAGRKAAFQRASSRPAHAG